MDRNQQPTSIIDTLGEEIIRIITPVSICMFLVVSLVLTLNSDPSSTSTSSGSKSIITIANLAYDETSSDSIWEKLEGALVNSLVFVIVVTLITFLLVFLFYIRCTGFLKYYMGFSALMVLGFMGGQVGILLIQKLGLPIDLLTYMIVLFNFSVVGVLAVFTSKMPILVTQGYLVVIGVLVAYWFTMLPEWTTWMLLVAMSLYDLGAVLLPGGPLRLLVELAISRDEDIPALVYEARPVIANEPSVVTSERRVWRDAREGHRVNVEMSTDQGRLSTVDSDADPEDVPLLENRIVSDDGMEFEGIGLGSSGAVKLGLGDFIFYSVLVGRAAMYDFMTVYACYLAIIAGLGITLMLLAFYQKALPALPVSVLLGVVFYVLTRTLLEVFMVQCSINLIMF